MPISPEILALLGAALGGYLAGAIPFALLLPRAMGLGDIRNIGSGNVGATNVLRTGHKGVAAATLILDGVKGALAVLVAALWGPELALTAGGCAVVGHIFPVWLRFKGGKGGATTIGVLLALSWPTALSVMGTWLVVAAISRYSSLAMICAMTLAPIFAWWFADPRLATLLVAISALVIMMHRANIRRLLAGAEPRITFAKDHGSGD